MKSLLRLYTFLRPYRLQATAALLLLLFMVAADLAIPRLTQRIIDQGIMANDVHVVITTSLYMVGAAILSVIFALANNALSVIAAMGFGANLRSSIMRKVQSFSFGNLDHIQTGNLIVRSTSDVNTVQLIVMMSLRIMTRALIWALGAAVMLVSTSPKLALIAGLVAPLIICMMWLFSRKSHLLFSKTQQCLDRLNTVLQENLAGIRVVKAFVRAAYEIARFDKANQDLMEKTTRFSELMAIFMPLVMLVLNLALILAIWIGGGMVLSDEISVGQVVAAFNYQAFALFPILMLGGMLGPLAAAEASAERILEVLTAEPRVTPPSHPVSLSDPKGKIVFEDVCFGYDADLSESVLKNVSFSAEPGETVAILGATGCGKSTLVHLIPRFYDVGSGRITFDGIDLRELDLRWLRGHVGMVLQEAVLFGGTIRDNIRFGRMDATEEEVRAAADIAQASRFIETLPDNYDTVVGQRGVTLSGGQRQRISIARTLLVGPRVLILDDATSALDVETEILLQEALNKRIGALQKPVTRFVVAQRISTVLTADKILLLDHGRIAATGTHPELLASNSIYQDIYRSQLGEPLVEGGAR